MGNLDTANIRINRKDYPRVLGLIPRSVAALGYDGNDHILIHDCPYALAKRFILRISSFQKDGMAKTAVPSFLFFNHFLLPFSEHAGLMRMC